MGKEPSDKTRIDELERRIKELELRPQIVFVPQPIYYPQPAPNYPPNPYWINPFYYQITCGIQGVSGA